jgi:hypothetical protein
MVSRFKFVLAAVLALFVTLGVMPSQAFATGVRSVYIVQTTAAGQESVMQTILSFGEVPLDQLDLIMDGFTVPLTEFEAAVLAADPEVVAIQLDQQMSLLETQTPTPSWGLDRIDQQTKVADNTYNYPADGGTGVRVYVVDTGVMATNPEFTGRILPGYDALGENLADSDCHGHGTHVAGTVAGTKYGVAKAATIVPIRVLACSGMGSTSGILKGFDWILANNPAGTPALVSMSIGGPLQPLFNAGLKKLFDAGILPIVAAGNSNDDACRYSPASALDALAVGASDISDNRANYSNYGDCVDVFAPGSSIVSANATNPTGSATMSGTSMATPHVSGLAALYLSQNPSATPAQITKAIRDNGILNGINNAQSQYGNILINNNFVRGAAPVTPNPNPVLNAPDQVASVTVTATGSNSGTVSWIDGPSNGGSPITGHVVRALAPGAIFAVANAVLGEKVTSYTLNGLDANTNYTFSVYAYNAIGSGKHSAGVVAKTAIGAPAAPVSVAVKPASTTAAVTWSQANDGGSPVTGYTVDLYSAGKWTTVGTSTIPSVTLTGLTVGGAYITRVKATNALGTSVVSKSVSFTTLPGQPDVPTGLTVTNVATTSATASWTPIVGGTPEVPVNYIVSYGIVGGTVHFASSTTPTVQLSPLAPGRNYSVTVRAQIGTLSSGESAPATFTTPATAPSASTGVTIVSAGATQTLRWNQAEDGGSRITGYIVEVSAPLASASAVADKWTVFAETTSTSIDIPAAPVAKYVRYRVISKNAVGLSAPSITAVTTTAPGKPTAPSGLRLSEPSSSGQITLSWNPPASDGGSAVTGYTVSINRDGKTWQTLANVSGTTLSFLTAKPNKGQTWSFNVYARNVSGISPTSESVSSSTATTVPGVVIALSAVLSGTEDISVRWAGVNDNGGLTITGYTLETLSNGVWSQLASLPANVLTYTAKRGLPGQMSSFRISATNSLGVGPIGPAASIMSPYLQASAPQDFTAAFNSATKKVDVSFTAPVDLGGSAINYYGLQVTKDAGKTWTALVSLTPTTLRYAATAPAKGQTWSYRVVAFTGFGGSLSSSAVEVALANTVPGSMNNPSVSLTGTSDILVRWSAVSDTGGLVVTYNLERQVDGIWTSVAQLPAATLNYTTSRPGPGVSAIFRISATNSVGAGPVSGSGSVMTPYVQAGAPQNFSAILNTTTNKVDVSFAAPANLGGSIVRGYVVQLSKDSGVTWSSITSLAATATSASLSAPAKGQTLSYRLIASTQFGAGLPSSSVTIAVATTVPGAPRVSGASLTGTGAVLIRWYAPTDNGGAAISSYKIQKASGADWVDSATSTGLTVEVPADLPGSKASWRVIAVNAVGDSVASSLANYTFPAVKATAVQDVTVVAGTVAKTIQVSYVAPANNGGSAVRYYYVYVSRDAGVTWSIVSSSSALTVRLTAPLKGATWQFKVAAVTSAGVGEFSSVVSFTGN